MRSMTYSINDGDDDDDGFQHVVCACVCVWHAWTAANYKGLVGREYINLR